MQPQEKCWPLLFLQTLLLPGQQQLWVRLLGMPCRAMHSLMSAYLWPGADLKFVISWSSCSIDSCCWPCWQYHGLAIWSETGNKEKPSLQPWTHYAEDVPRVFAHTDLGLTVKCISEQAKSQAGAACAGGLGQLLASESGSVGKDSAVCWLVQAIAWYCHAVLLPCRFCS